MIDKLQKRGQNSVCLFWRVVYVQLFKIRGRNEAIGPNCGRAAIKLNTGCSLDIFPRMLKI